MQLVAIKIHKEFKKQKIKIAKFTYYKNNTVIRQNKTISLNDAIINLIIMLLYIDDGALPFELHKDIIKEILICINIIEKFG